MEDSKRRLMNREFIRASRRPLATAESLRTPLDDGIFHLAPLASSPKNRWENSIAAPF
jgi:hypothetical protein